MKENKYDDIVFFEKYSQMDRSRLDWRASRGVGSVGALLPDFAGKRVLDLAAATAGTASMRRNTARRLSPAWTCRRKCWPWPGKRPRLRR